jgi:hypothetical protein
MRKSKKANEREKMTKIMEISDHGAFQVKSYVTHMQLKAHTHEI